MKSMGKNMPIRNFCLQIEHHHSCLQKLGNYILMLKGNLSIKLCQLGSFFLE